jgi:hypothetical protein
VATSLGGRLRALLSAPPAVLTRSRGSCCRVCRAGAGGHGPAHRPGGRAAAGQGAGAQGQQLTGGWEGGVQGWPAGSCAARGMSEGRRSDVLLSPGLGAPSLSQPPPALHATSQAPHRPPRPLSPPALPAQRRHPRPPPLPRQAVAAGLPAAPSGPARPCCAAQPAARPGGPHAGSRHSRERGVRQGTRRALPPQRHDGWPNHAVPARHPAPRAAGPAPRAPWPSAAAPSRCRAPQTAPAQPAGAAWG